MDEQSFRFSTKHITHCDTVSAVSSSYLNGIQFDSLVIYRDHVFSGRLVYMWGLLISATAVPGYDLYLNNKLNLLYAQTISNYSWSVSVALWVHFDGTYLITGWK
jgi:hypothetical protein